MINFYHPQSQIVTKLKLRYNPNWPYAQLYTTACTISTLECVDRREGRYQTKTHGNLTSSEQSNDEVSGYSQVKTGGCVAAALCSQA